MSVFIVQEVYGRNFLPAKEYGELVPMLPYDMQIYLSTAPAARKLTRFLQNFSDNDYILLVGDPVLIGLATAIACMHNRGKAKLLKWDKRTMGYHPVEVDLIPKENDDA